MSFYSKGRIRRSLLYTAAFRATTQFATFAAYVVLVRGMAEQSFGVLNLLYSVIPLLSTAASLGIEQTLRRYQPEYLATRPEAAAWLLRVAGWLRLATNLFLLCTILLLWQWIAPLFHLEAYRTEFAIFGFLVLLHFQASILQISLSSHMLQGYSVGMTLVLSVVKLIAYLVLARHDALTLVNAIYADIAGYALMYAGLRIAHYRHCPLPPPHFRLDRNERHRLLKYSLYNNFNDAGTLLLTSKSDNFFIAALMNPAAVGAYSFYVRLNEMTANLLPTRQFSNVVQPLFFSIPAEEAKTRVPRYFTLLVNLTGTLQLPMFVFALCYHSEIVSAFFGGKFIDSSWLLPIIVGFATLNRSEVPVMLVAQYQEKASIILLSKIFAIYNAVALLALVPIAGVYGAAIATGSAQMMKNLFIWWHVRGAARWTNLGAVITMAVIIWGPCALACFALKSLLHLPPLWDLMIGAALCGLGALLYVRSPALSQSDRHILASVFHGREGRILTWLGIARPANPR